MRQINEDTIFDRAYLIVLGSHTIWATKSPMHGEKIVKTNEDEHKQ